MNNIFKFGAIAAASVLMMTSCDDWTETESIGLDYATIDKAYPELYAAYLQNLRDYRDTEHTKVYAWFDNVDEAVGQAHRLTVLPDSIDVVSLTNPENVSQQTLRQIKEIREQKGMKVIYTVDYDAMAARYNTMKEIAADQGTEIPSLRDFIADTTARALQPANIYGFDGICVAYNGKDRTFMSSAEFNDYEAMENLFLGLIKDWHQRNPGKSIDYMGNPQHLLDKSLLDDCGMVFLSEGLSAGSYDAFTLALSSAQEQGVPTEKLGLVARSISVDDAKAGVMSDGSNAVETLGLWAAANPVAGIGFFGIQDDYYNNTFIYSHSRTAIRSVNP